MRRFVATVRRGPVLLAVVLVALSAAAAELSVPDFGVGTDVVDRELRGRAERFEEGTRVWFWTRVLGAERGDGIRHVWLRDGKEQASVDLGVDGSPWRTYSAKRLHPGSVGSWTVEARDRAGKVLARQSFECAARSEPPTPADPDSAGS